MGYKLSVFTVVPLSPRSTATWAGKPSRLSIGFETIGHWSCHARGCFHRFSSAGAKTQCTSRVARSSSSSSLSSSSTNPEERLRANPPNPDRRLSCADFFSNVYVTPRYSINPNPSIGPTAAPPDFPLHLIAMHWIE